MGDYYGMHGQEGHLLRFTCDRCGRAADDMRLVEFDDTPDEETYIQLCGDCRDTFERMTPAGRALDAETWRHRR